MPALTRTFRAQNLRKLLRYRSGHEIWAIRAIAAIVFINGFAALAEVLSTRISPRFESLLPVNYEYYGRSFGIFVGFTLIYISSRLLLRKYLAWVIAMVGSIGIIAAHVFYFHTEAAIILPFAALILLVMFRSEFVAKSEPATLKQGGLLLIISLSVAVIYGTIGFSRLLPKDFTPSQHFSYAQGFDRTLREFSLLGNDDIHPRTRTAQWFIDSLDLLGATSVAFAIFSLFRPIQYRFAERPQLFQRASSVLDRFGTSSEDAFKLWPADKSYFFVSNGDAFVAYLVQSGSALVLGEPVGPIHEWPRLLSEFQAYCRRHDWLIAMIYLPPEHLSIVEQAGMRSVKIGEDAIVETARFMESTGRNKHFRAVRNKFVRLAYEYVVSEAPHTPEILRSTATVSRNWLGGSGRKERGFALGSYDRNYMKNCRLHLLYDASGQLIAFANEIRSYNPEQSTIDLMRHKLKTETGAMDYLFLSMIEYTYLKGIAEFSLGIAPLAGLKDEGPKPVEQRFLSYVGTLGFGGFAFEGLRRYKSKFEPRWEDRYMAYDAGPAGFLRSGNALNTIVN